MSVIYGEYLVNVHFSDIPHTFIPHFTLHSAEKIGIKFSTNYPLTTFRIPQNTPSLATGSDVWCSTNEPGMRQLTVQTVLDIIHVTT